MEPFGQPRLLTRVCLPAAQRPEAPYCILSVRAHLVLCAVGEPDGILGADLGDLETGGESPLAYGWKRGVLSGGWHSSIPRVGSSLEGLGRDCNP